MEQNWPPIMANAQEDLAGNVSGQFSPEDWDKIRARAAELLRHSSKPPQEAWVDVILAFQREKYWGFVPNYKKPKIRPEDKNLGVQFIWYCCRSFLITKVIVLYAGARFSLGHEPIWGWIFFAAVAFMVISYSRFLWKHRNRKDE
jgi:hypothetical protein